MPRCEYDNIHCLRGAWIDSTTGPSPAALFRRCNRRCDGVGPDTPFFTKFTHINPWRLKTASVRRDIKFPCWLRHGGMAAAGRNLRCDAREEGSTGLANPLRKRGFRCRIAGINIDPARAPAGYAMECQAMREAHLPLAICPVFDCQKSAIRITVNRSKSSPALPVICIIAA